MCPIQVDKNWVNAEFVKNSLIARYFSFKVVKFISNKLYFIDLTQWVVRIYKEDKNLTVMLENNNTKVFEILQKGNAP